jgi:hypothetical protein
MSSLMKILAGTALGAGVIATISYFRRLQKTQAELEIIPVASLHQLSWNAVTIKVDVLLKNPTKGAFKIKFPFVKLIYHGTTMGSSQAVDKDIHIPSFGEAKIENILIQLPVAGVFSIVAGIVTSIKNKEPVKFSIKTMTVIDIGIARIPYENETEVLLKK